MKFFLLGFWGSNDGPSNVNRSLVQNSDECMEYLKWRRFGRIERWLKCIFCNPIVISAGITKIELLLLKLFHKKTIYILHGYRKYENEINNLRLNDTEIQLESEALRYSDIILPVSEKYSEWVKKMLPEYNNKIKYLNNGITISRRLKKTKEKYSIAVTGGNRKIKNNALVCEAVSKLISDGYDCKVFVFGLLNDDNDDLTKYPFVTFMGQMAKDEYYEALDKISLLILNSKLELFGLVVADAINCNCSLLMSNNVGAASIMRTTDDDIIYDTNDINEISTKALNLLKYGNNDRLYNSIDVEDCSCKSAYNKLKHIVYEL